MSRNLRTTVLATLSTAWLLAAFALCAPPSTAAQVCDEEDAGDEDGGSDEDGGLVCEPSDSGMPVAQPDASTADGGGGEVDAGGDIGAACSCETVENTGGGPIHVCTGARERDVCQRFECESSIVRDRACPTSGVALCCELPARGLYSQLYEDCTHPNCETGFRAQCGDFGGTITEGPCAVDDTDGASDESGGGCSVHARTRTPGLSGVMLCMLAIALAMRARKTRSRG